MSDSDSDTTALEARIERLEAENAELKDELAEYRTENEQDKAAIRRDIHEYVEVHADAGDEPPSLEDVWIAGLPFGKLLNTVKTQLRDDGGLLDRVIDLEDRHGQSDTRATTDRTDGDDRSPLARLIDVPAERAQEFLSANQVRGRKIAQRAREIGKNTPEGLVVRSDEIAKRLRRWGESSHTETVSRVMDFIEDLGTDDVRSTMHKGRRVLVFDCDRVKRYGTGAEPTEVRSHRDVIPTRTSGTGPAPA